MQIKGVMRKSSTGIDFAVQQGDQWKKVKQTLPFMSMLRQFYDAILTNESRVLLFGRVYHITEVSRKDNLQRVLEFDTPFFRVTMIKYMTSLDGNAAQLDKVNVTLEIPEEMSVANTNA